MPTSKTYPFELIKNPSFPLYVIKSSNISLVPRHRKREGAASLAKLPSCVSPRRNDKHSKYLIFVIIISCNNVNAKDICLHFSYNSYNKTKNNYVFYCK